MSPARTLSDILEGKGVGHSEIAADMLLDEPEADSDDAVPAPLLQPPLHSPALPALTPPPPPPSYPPGLRVTPPPPPPSYPPGMLLPPPRPQHTAPSPGPLPRPRVQFGPVQTRTYTTDTDARPGSRYKPYGRRRSHTRAVTSPHVGGPQQPVSSWLPDLLDAAHRMPVPPRRRPAPPAAGPRLGGASIASPGGAASQRGRQRGM